MSISWGRKQRFRFNAAGTVDQFTAPEKLAAVYAVTYKRDAANRPKSHTVLYFGESADAGRDIKSECNNIKELWHKKGSNETELFVFYLSLPNSTPMERAAIQSQLIAEYDPMMNNDN